MKSKSSLLNLVLALSSCTTTNYKAGGIQGEWSFGQKKKDEKVVQYVSVENTEHFFLFGLIGSGPQDVERIIPLRPGQRATNLSIKNERSGVNVLVDILGCVFTACLVTPIIWQMRTSTIEAVVVE